MHARINHRAHRAARECSCKKCCGCRLLTCCFGCRCACVKTYNGKPAVTACKNCVLLGKQEKAMFRAHSDACLSQSRVNITLVEALLKGELNEDPALKKHVYCVLVKCKVVGKDGKLLKTAVMGKLAVRNDGRNASKVLENCAEQSADSASSPEDVAWNLFRCGYDRKAVLFDYMPTGAGAGGEDEAEQEHE